MKAVLLLKASHKLLPRFEIVLMLQKYGYTCGDIYHHRVFFATRKIGCKIMFNLYLSEDNRMNTMTENYSRPNSPEVHLPNYLANLALSAALMLEILKKVSDGKEVSRENIKLLVEAVESEIKKCTIPMLYKVKEDAAAASLLAILDER